MRAMGMTPESDEENTRRAPRAPMLTKTTGVLELSDESSIAVDGDLNTVVEPGEESAQVSELRSIRMPAQGRGPGKGENR